MVKKKKTIITFFPDAQPEKKLPTPGVGFKRQRLPAVPSDGSEQPLRIRLDRKCMARKEWCQQVPGTRAWLHYLPPRTQRQMSAGHVLRPTSRDLRGTLGPQTTLRQSINEKKKQTKNHWVSENRSTGCWLIRKFIHFFVELIYSGRIWAHWTGALHYQLINGRRLKILN